MESGGVKSQGFPHSLHRHDLGMKLSRYETPGSSFFLPEQHPGAGDACKTLKGENVDFHFAFAREDRDVLYSVCLE